MYDISVSIVLHRTNRELVKSVLDALKNEHVSAIYLIDNSPKDSLSEFAEYDTRITYKHIPNRGFGNAHNIAIRESMSHKSDFHLVLNPDVRWKGEILQKLAAEMDKHENCALLQPKIFYPDGRLQHTCRLLPTPFDVFAKRFLPSFERRLERYLLADEDYNREFNAVNMQGSFMLFRTSAFDVTGLFDERFFMYLEDIDMTRRIRRRFSTLYYPGVTITHDHAALSQKFGRMMWVHICSVFKYFNKWGWVFDKERRLLNRQLLAELESVK